MRHDDDYREQTYTVKLFWPGCSVPDFHRGCTEVDQDHDPGLTFRDSSGKEHKCGGGVIYEVLEE